MPSKTDFNVSPYYDDFSGAKKFHRVMYRPAFAVQARELTTQQSINQNQIEKFGDHMFKQGAMVIPGQISTDFHFNAVKLTSFTGTLANFDDNTVTGGTSGVVADVVSYVATDGTDPDTIFVKYRTSGTDNVSVTFTETETLTSGAATGETAVVSTTVEGSAVKIEAGTYYINGFFVDVTAQTLILDKYTNTPTYRVGLTIAETFVTSTDDTSLLDNATGSSNVNATGAHRFKIDLTLSKLALDSTADSSFVELLRVQDGAVVNKVDTTQYSIVEDTLARRTFDESGDYVVRNFDLDVREHLISGTNRGIYAADATSVDGNTANEAKLALGLSQGKAYVKGYEIAKHGTTYVDMNKARDYETDSGITTRFSQISFVNVTNLYGTPDVGFVSGETEVYKKVRLVDTEHSTRGTALTNNDGTIYDVGRAKSRGIEYNSGDASGVFMSTAALKTNTYKHYLFDTVMFAHLNIKGAASGALTDGETLTGGTSGATAIVESITSLGTATITGVTAANPPVVTMSAGHNFTEGQQILIASAAGMTSINTYHTVKNPSATTLELYTAAGATGTPSAVNGTGYTAWSSGGTVAHTIAVLSNVKGTFSENETCTGGSSSETVVVQYDAFGCKGFEQKQFTQTKGISMAGSPTYTADVDLTTTYGDVKTLSGTVSTVDPDVSPGSIIMDGSDVNGTDTGDSIIIEDATETGSAVIAIGLEDPADQADVLLGSATKFTSELKIGDQINFEDDSNTTVTRLVQSIHSDTKLETAVGLGTTSATSKIFKRQRTKIQSANNDKLLFKLPYNVTKTLLTTDNSGVSDTSFKIRRQFVSTLSSSGTATLTAGTNEIFSAHSENDFTVSIMTKGGSASAGEVGDVITLAGSGDFTLGGSPTGKTLAIDLGSTYNGSKIKILATISASVVGAKTKTTTTATTTVATAALSGLTQINLGYADVHTLTSVYMAADFSTAAATTDTDITDRFNLDSGMRDNFYDVGRLIRKAGKVAPTGRLLITYSYFAHGAGNLFSVDSYSGFDYGSIPTYTSDVTGERFDLRDTLDFRPRVDNASTIDAGDGQDRQYSGTGASTLELVKFNSDITADLEYYLSRRDKIFMASNGDFKVISGASSLDPIEPEGIADAMLLYKLFVPAYTFKTSDIAIRPQDNRRYTMRDIGRIEKRVESIEYYTQLSLLESEAQNMQIQDADGFDRFKNGIIVDNFTGHGIADVTDNDYSVSMDMANGELRPAFHQDNIKLIESDSVLENSTAMSDTIRTTNGYQKTGDLITLPYTSVEYASQPYASTTVNLQPFNVIDYIGTLSLSPEMDEWMATEVLPEMQVDMPGTFDTLTSLAAAGVLDLNLGTVWGNWNEQWSGSVQEVNRTSNTSGPRWGWQNTQTSITTEQRVGLRRAGIRTGLIPNAVRTSFGDRVVSVAFAPFMRQKDITFTAKDMKPLSRIYPFFDSIDVSNYVTPTGSSAGAALITDASGEATGVFSIPDPTNTANPKWRTGKRTFRLTTSSTNSLVVDITTSAESDYSAKGMIQQVQETVVSTREPQISRQDVQETQTVTRTNISTENTRNFSSQPRHSHRNPDPIAQSFRVDADNGLFITSLDVYFRSKSSVTPVQIQLRTMVNGYPSEIIIPFGQIFVAADDVSISTDASEATTFTFPSPVFLKENTEYAFVVKSNSKDYNMYTARMGQKTLDDSRLISKQPFFGSMFKSQNGSTWTAEQNEDVKFEINRAQFTTNTTGTVNLVNDVVPVKTLKQNPLTTTSSSGVIVVYHPNHGMHSTAANVTIAGVASGSYNGIAHTNINGTYTTIGNIKLDSYTITAQNSDTADTTGDVGGTTVTATRNILFDVIQPVVGVLQPPSTTVTSTIRTTGGRTLESTETEYSLTASGKAVSVTFNEDYYMTAPRMIASAINETNEMSSSKSFNMNISISTPTANNNISPVIDTQRLSAFLIQNRLNNPISGTTPDFTAETTNTGGSAAAKYMTRPVILENDATSLDIRISASVQSTSTIRMYFRATSAEDARKLGDVVWTAFNSDGTSDSAVEPSKTSIEFKEYKFSVSSLPAFTAFQLKVVLSGTNSSYPPLLKDMRGIALAV